LGSALGAKVIYGPSSPADQPSWLAGIISQRATDRASVNFNPWAYNNYIPWTTFQFIAPQRQVLLLPRDCQLNPCIGSYSMVTDTYFYSNGIYTGATSF
jgi:hypothetical protein